MLLFSRGKSISVFLQLIDFIDSIKIYFFEKIININGYDNCIDAFVTAIGT